MSEPHLRIALLGGVPAILGGGGLEVQMQRTQAALRALGHDARPAHEWSPGDAVDVVHAFNHGGDILHSVDHWRRTPAAFVFSPVLVVEPGHEWRTRLGRHLPVHQFPARAIRTLVRKADVTVGLTDWERHLMAKLGGVEPAWCVAIGNGVDPVESVAPPADLPARFVVSLGSVSPRKRQLEVAQALAGSGTAYVVIGGFEGPGSEAFGAAVAATGGRWLGELHDQSTIRAVLGQALALIQLSEREGQSLAVLEALSAGTPVVGSDLPSHTELRAAHPGWVAIADEPAEVLAATASVVASSAAATVPTIPTWAEIGASLVEAYRLAITRGPRTGQER